MKCVVIGAGINGLSTAIWLQRLGHDVKLVDRAEPGSGTSYGNAGILAAGAVLPVTVPGLIAKIPKMVLSRKSPLFLRWRYLPRLLPFLMKYLSFGTKKHVSRFAQEMSYLLGDSYDQHMALAQGTGAARFIHPDDYCHGYDSQAALDADMPAIVFRRALGYQIDIETGEEFAKTDPFHQGNFSHVARHKNHGRISDPLAYSRALFAHFLNQGGAFLNASVSDVVIANGEIECVQSDQGPITAEQYVFTLGPWVQGISKQLGLSIPLESEGGYHVELINPSLIPKLPVMISAGKFVVTPMAGRIRLAGLLEFAGLDAPDNPRAVDYLTRHIAKYLPHVRYDDMKVWHGFRPTTANSYPVIGRPAHLSNAHVGFGHQHIGLTAGPKTGRILAEMISNRPVNKDLSVFDPNQYLAVGMEAT
jgi:D-amino-acid dehydrogenase